MGGHLGYTFCPCKWLGVSIPDIKLSSLFTSQSTQSHVSGGKKSQQKSPVQTTLIDSMRSDILMQFFFVELVDNILVIFIFHLRNTVNSPIKAPGILLAVVGRWHWLIGVRDRSFFLVMSVRHSQFSSQQLIQLCEIRLRRRWSSSLRIANH